MAIICSEKMEQYFSEINNAIKETYKIATDARKKGYDPEEKVDIPIARDMAERVEGLISAVAPQIIGSGVSDRIRELEKLYGVLDWRVAFKIAEEVALNKFCKFNNQQEAIETGIRVGFAYLTLGTVASPLEGFLRIGFGKRLDNGKEYMIVYYAGPVRSAGGTGASVSVLISDYVRKKMGYAAYDPTELEVKRLTSELYDYHERIANLQYLPSIEEITFLAQNIPVQINGEPSETLEVSNYKDLPRVETNNLRNGVCLVLGEGIAQKAPKLWKQLSKWGKDFDMEQWFFLEEFLKLQKNIKAKGNTTVKTEHAGISPDYTFIHDLVAGRPVLTDPLAVGGFRLRFGRSRTSGYSSYSIHPATMNVLNKYIATGTQLKLERPGKGTAVTACDSIDGPIVKLQNGSVIKLSSTKDIKTIAAEITEILFLGDILINYGDFFNRAHVLIPPGYCPEWWILELEKAMVGMFGSLDIDKLSEFTQIPSDPLKRLLQKPINTKITPHDSLILSEKMNIPFHPDYTFYWSTITSEDILNLVRWMEKAQISVENNEITKIVVPHDAKNKRILELLGVPHILASNEFVVIEKDDAKALAITLGLLHNDIQSIIAKSEQNMIKAPLELINYISPVKIRDKAGTFIGARMGRPEKAKMRQLTGSPQVLFPVGKEGDRLRSFQASFDVGKISADFPIYYCPTCEKETVLSVCLICNHKTKKLYNCKICGTIPDEICPKHGKALRYKQMEIDVNEYFELISKKLNTKILPDLIKGVRGTSNKDHIPEHPLKGVLRAKHLIYVNKDGTTRYDMTQLGITHFKPVEIGTSIDTLKKLGYLTDIHGYELLNVQQILEIKPQDIILPACLDSPNEGADKVLFRTTQFLDELLVHLYGLKPFYNLQSEKDLIGHLVLALAPHTSAAMVARIIGFSKTQGFFAHPLLHASTRRDLDGDEASVILLMDALLNFSRQFLPAHRGAVQDAPLVLTTNLIPGEVDDMVFDLDCVWRYPLEFYEACLQYKKPWDITLDQLGKRINTPLQYEKIGYTHDTTDFNAGVNCSAYKILPSMEEKLNGQMDLAKKIRAVNENEVARLVIEKHFLKDIRGNLRKFSIQQFRCVKCNEKYRRPPLQGKCTKCGGKIIFTISEGFIVKYLEPTFILGKNFSLPPYLQHTLELTRRMIESIFGKEREKQEGLEQWVS